MSDIAGEERLASSSVRWTRSRRGARFFDLFSGGQRVALRATEQARQCVLERLARK